MQILPEKQAEYDAYVKLNSGDPYSHRVVAYSEDWANLMEAELAKDVPIATSAKPTSRTADTDGITGFMYGCAVSALSTFWIYGEALRRWHNIDTQLGNEGETANANGGVLNPALLTISSK